MKEPTASKTDLEIPMNLWTALQKKGINPIEVLSTAGFEIDGEHINLYSQLQLYEKILRDTGDPQDPSNKESLQYKRHKALTEVNDWLKEYIVEQPEVVLLSALIWLSYKRSLLNRVASNPNNATDQDWAIFTLKDGEVDLQATFVVISDFKSRLLGSLQEMPQDTLNAIRNASCAYELVLANRNPYNSVERLESFLRTRLGSWINPNKERVKSIELVIKLSEILFLKTVGKSKKSGVPSLLLKVLDFHDRASNYQISTLISILESWHNIVYLDYKSLSRYKSPHTLYLVASKACGGATIKSKQNIAAKIDRATNYQYHDLKARVKIYRAIDRLYTQRTINPEQQSVGRSYTLAQDEMEIFVFLLKQHKGNKGMLIENCINCAIQKIKKNKEALMSHTIETRRKATTTKINIRLMQQTVSLLNDLVKDLNKSKVFYPSIVKNSAAIGLALKLYVADTNIRQS